MFPDSESELVFGDAVLAGDSMQDFVCCSGGSSIGSIVITGGACIVDGSSALVSVGCGKRRGG